MIINTKAIKECSTPDIFEKQKYTKVIWGPVELVEYTEMYSGNMLFFDVATSNGKNDTPWNKEVKNIAFSYYGNEDIETTLFDFSNKAKVAQTKKEMIDFINKFFKYHPYRVFVSHNISFDLFHFMRFLGNDFKKIYNEPTIETAAPIFINTLALANLFFPKELSETQELKVNIDYKRDTSLLGQLKMFNIDYSQDAEFLLNKYNHRSDIDSKYVVKIFDSFSEIFKTLQIETYGDLLQYNYFATSPMNLFTNIDEDSDKTRCLISSEDKKYFEKVSKNYMLNYTTTHDQFARALDSYVKLSRVTEILNSFDESTTEKLKKINPNDVIKNLYTNVSKNNLGKFGEPMLKYNKQLLECALTPSHDGEISYSNISALSSELKKDPKAFEDLIFAVIDNINKYKDPSHIFSLFIFWDSKFFAKDCITHAKQVPNKFDDYYYDQLDKMIEKTLTRKDKEKFLGIFKFIKITLNPYNKNVNDVYKNTTYSQKTIETLLNKFSYFADKGSYYSMVKRFNKMFEAKQTDLWLMPYLQEELTDSTTNEVLEKAEQNDRKTLLKYLFPNLSETRRNDARLLRRIIKAGGINTLPVSYFSYYSSDSDKEKQAKDLWIKDLIFDEKGDLIISPQDIDILYNSWAQYNPQTYKLNKKYLDTLFSIYSKTKLDSKSKYNLWEMFGNARFQDLLNETDYEDQLAELIDNLIDKYPEHFNYLYPYLDINWRSEDKYIKHVHGYSLNFVPYDKRTLNSGWYEMWNKEHAKYQNNKPNKEPIVSIFLNYEEQFKLAKKLDKQK